MTRPPEASAPAPASEAAPPAPASGVLLPPEAIFDASALSARLQPALDRAQAEPLAARAALVAALAEAATQGHAAIAAAFARQPRQGRPVARAYAALMDGLLGTLFSAAATRFHPAPTPTAAERLALIAVGGYGRAEMAPFSDLDLLFLTPLKPSPWAESVIETVLYAAWDLHLKLGHASRPLDDCLARARADFTIRTALLECRPLAGDAALAAELRTRLRAEVFAGTAPEFIEAKLAEREARHRRHGNFRYMLEPNVKEGKGGLRDLQSLFWIDKYLHGVEDLSQLVGRGVFTAAEFAAFREAEAFLLAVRCHLHLIAGRAQDVLTFEMQVEVAARMGYADGGGRRAVEHFMQDYFRQATRVGETTRIFLTDLEAQHVKAAPQRSPSGRRRPGPPYALRHNRLTVADQAAFLADPLNLLRIFEVAQRSGYPVHPDAMRLLARNLPRIDTALRQDPRAGALFLDLLTRRGNPERTLRRMNELGVLAAFLPEFAPVVAMMQFNMYHAYTVDEHLIQCVAILSRIERGELVEELPLTSEILKTGTVNRRVLYLAVLLHDIGKGLDEDHAILGARLARRVAARLGLKPEEVETVEWLVRHHLLMSDVAQKRDISDPATLRAFARQVKTRARLDLLTALTVCDIRGVGPGVWNNWKAQILRNLYHETARVLEGGLEALSRDSRADEARRALRKALAGWDRKALRRELARHRDPYWQGMPLEAQLTVARLLRELTGAADGQDGDPAPDAPADAGRHSDNPADTAPEPEPEPEPGRNRATARPTLAAAPPPLPLTAAEGADTAAPRRTALEADMDGGPAAAAPPSPAARIDLQVDPARDATRAVFVVADAPGLFSRLAGALTGAGASVVDARTYTTSDGFATAAFWVQDAEGHPYEESRLPRLCARIERVLAGQAAPQEGLASRDVIRRKERVFRQPTAIRFDNEASDLCTLIEVDSRDRPGLLWDVTRTLAASNVQIVSAVIATYGAQAVDSFYVKDSSGLKLQRKDRCAALEKRLREAIAAGEAGALGGAPPGAAESTPPAAPRGPAPDTPAGGAAETAPGGRPAPMPPPAGNLLSDPAPPAAATNPTAAAAAAQADPGVGAAVPPSPTAPPTGASREAEPPAALPAAAGAVTPSSDRSDSAASAAAGGRRGKTVSPSPREPAAEPPTAALPASEAASPPPASPPGKPP